MTNNPPCPRCKLPGGRFTAITDYRTPTRIEDSKGNVHFHDNNIVFENYRCWNDHTWLERAYNSCECGWSQERHWTEEEIKAFKEMRQR